MAAAGSWDHFHEGHERFLNEAFKISKRVSVGVTSDEMIENKKFNESLQGYEIRKKAVAGWLEKNKLMKRTQIIKLDNIYGPTIASGSDLAGVLVTKETLAGGKKVNLKRKSLNLKPLLLIEAKMHKGINSVKIRAGRMNRRGIKYYEIFEKAKQFELPKKLRAGVAKPFGKLIKGILTQRPEGKIVCVGDVVTRIFLENKWSAEQFIVDLKVERNLVYDSIEEIGFDKKTEVVEIKNPAGVITGELAKAIDQNHEVILVKGEEDLAVIPVVLSVPLGWKVIYGQPNQGVVIVEVTEKKKEAAYNLLRKFKDVK